MKKTKRFCTHYFRILRDRRPAILYVHKLDRKYCATHTVAAPTDCRCEPECRERFDISTSDEFIFDVEHQNTPLSDSHLDVCTSGE